MKPVERRLVRELPVLRRHLTRSAATAFLAAGLIVAQATLLATVLADGFTGDPVGFGLPLALGAVVAGRALLAWARGVLAHRAAADAKHELRDRLTDRLSRTAPLRLAARSHGATATLLLRGLDALDPYVVGSLPAMTAAAVVPATVLGWLFVTDWPSALIIVVTLPLIPLFGALVGKHTARRTARQWRLLARLGGHFLDVVAGLPTLRAFGREEHQARQIGEMAQAHRRATMRTLRVAFLSSLVLETVATLAVALVAVPIGLRLLHGTVDLRTALIVLFLAPEAYLPLRAMGAAFHESAEGITVAEQVFATLDEHEHEHEQEQEQEYENEHGHGAGAGHTAGRRAPTPDACSALVRLHEVTVRFPGRTAPALDHVSLHVSPGEHIALVGPSGAGKSTLLALLLGFVTPSAGRITVAGTDLRCLDPDDWRTRLAWVPQRPHLFAATVADNIRLGRPDASRAEVRQAARDAHAEHFIQALPRGFDTPLGEHGAGLSAGQRQRIALARAFLKDSPVLLLDEPTAHLDGESEAAVTRATARLMRGRTAIVVAHRTSLLPYADRILTVRAGRLETPQLVPTQRPVS
ncbi:thiol reductant ABC exporter subunit CydD [Streptomyces sp. NPDC050147]|uniref:thiol reductant ABC exporter subunit CydD n=1 Tax=Streptomyces sp. NPDC050147 TaxID=3155513 RepID=UPI00342B93B5